MPVNTCRSDYEERAKEWKRLRDCYNGRDALLKAGTEYVPDLPGLNFEGNMNYRKRGSFYNALGRTLSGLVGLVFQKTPVFDVPEAFATYLKDITLTNISMEMFALEAAREAILVARYGILVDVPTPDQPVALASPYKGGRPFLIGYNAEDIINWRTLRVNGDEQLTLLVLREFYEERADKDDFVFKVRPQYRVCRLTEAGYTQEVWRKPEDKTEFVLNEGPILVTKRGKPLDFIPFVFVGPDHVTPELKRPPLLDLADVNLSHWRNSVDYEYGLHLVALPTPWVAGAKGDGALKIGPSTVWDLAAEGRAGMLEFTGAGLAAIHDSMDEKKKQMASFGAQMLLGDQRISNETATAARLKHSGEGATLRTVAQSLEQALTMALQMLVWWDTTLTARFSDVEVACELNKDFVTKLSPEEATALMGLWQSGAISHKTLYHNLQIGEWARPSVTFEQEQQDLDDEEPEEPEPVVAPVLPMRAVER